MDKKGLIMETVHLQVFILLLLSSPCQSSDSSVQLDSSGTQEARTNRSRARRGHMQSAVSAASAQAQPPTHPQLPHATTTSRAAADQEPEPPTVLMVWRKSLLFNCDGFTVYDANGDLAFRVDSYAASRRRHTEVVLMDDVGAPLLTVRRKRLNLAERWLIYDGADDAASSRPPLLSVRRHVGLHFSGGKTLAHVAASSSAADEAFVVEGSYGRRACAGRDALGDVVAEVRHKEAVGNDVFRLVVSPRLGAPLAMGLVIALDEMFGSRGSTRSWLRNTCEDRQCTCRSERRPDVSVRASLYPLCNV